MSIREGTQLLYCKWCPSDCQDLTREESLGCLASGGFIDDAFPYLKAEIEKMKNPYDWTGISENWGKGEGYNQAIQDILKLLEEK